VTARPAHGEGVDALLTYATVNSSHFFLSFFIFFGEGVNALLTYASVNSSLLLLSRSICRCLLCLRRVVCLFYSLVGLFRTSDGTRSSVKNLR